MKRVRLCGGPFNDRTIDLEDGMKTYTVRDSLVNRNRTIEATYVPCDLPRKAADGVELWRISPVHATYEHAPRS